MVHKLLIELEINYAEDQFKNLLHGLEFPRGAKISINVYITNISESVFSGTLDSFFMTFGGAVAALNVLEHPKKRIDSLSPNEKTLMYQTIYQLSLEGIAWIKCKLNADDSQPIEYYQTKQSIPLPDEWIYPIHVLNREQLLMVDLLTEIRDKINSSLKV